MVHLLASLASVCALAVTSAFAQDPMDDGPMETSRIDLSIQYNKIVVAHLVFAILTFLVLVPSAILIARFGRTYFKWYHHHRNIQLVSIAFFLVAFFLGISAAYPAPVGEQTHYQVGVAIFVLYFVQIALGMGAHRYLRKTGQRYIGYVHAPLGLIIFGLAVWNMETGWNIWGSGYVAGAAPRDVIYAWMGFLVLLYLIGLAFIPREIKQARRQKEVGGKTDIEPVTPTSSNNDMEQAVHTNVTT
jgi:Kef-type K+ transport system membrane component KefB